MVVFGTGFDNVIDEYNDASTEHSLNVVAGFRNSLVLCE